MLNLTQLHYFRLVAQTQNFASAAKLAHITQPALSNSIRALEDKIGVQLFDRKERPIRITPVGRDLLKRIDTLVLQSNQLEKEITLISQGMAGTIRIGMTAHSSASIGGKIIGKWLTQNENMGADITIADTLVLLDKLYSERLDAMIGDSRDINNNSLDLKILSLPSQQGRAYCRRAHPVLNLKNINFNDLLPYRFAGSHFTKSLFDHIEKTLNIKDEHKFQLAIESDNITLVRDATINSNLIMLATDQCLRAEVELGMLSELSVDLKTPTIWQFVTIKNSIEHPALNSLVNVIENNLQF